MDHAVVENEKRQTDIKTVSDDARTGATKTNMQPPDTTTLEGTIANEANPNTNPHHKKRCDQYLILR
ncbi:unnamed protein product [Rotaria sordida]|uniref:Uncharacterized protein n=2 Tax=Rotaria sordida TaxID=392033 RepID=A0A814LV99_9BILA|nr:unnamed protein product [Rotaria sordida]